MFLKSQKRTLSFLLALILVLSTFLSVVVLPASAAESDVAGTGAVVAIRYDANLAAGAGCVGGLTNLSCTTEEFESLEAAVASADEGDVVVLTANYTLNSNLTVPAGVTLLIPFDAAYSLYTTAPKAAAIGSQDAGDCYCKLTIGANTTLTVNGELSLSSKHCCTQTNGSYSAVAGNYSRIDLGAGSNLIMNNGSTLYAWGYITGAGTVDALDGSTVYEVFQVNDYRGSMVTFNMAEQAGSNESVNQFPFNQYYVQNIESEIVYHYGAVEYIVIDLDHNNVSHQASACFIGSQGMFALNNDASVLKRHYDYVNDKMHYSLEVDGNDDPDNEGGASLNPITVMAFGQAIPADIFYLPINNLELEIESGTLDSSCDIVFLPGSGLTVDDGATVILTDGANVVVADTDIGNYSSANGESAPPCVPVRFSPSRAESTEPVVTRTWETTEPAYVDNNGLVVVEEGAALGSTNSGANLYSSTGNGAYSITGSNEPVQLFVLESIDSEGTPTTSYINTEEVVLRNEESGSCDTSKKWFENQPTVFRQDSNGVWGDYRYLQFYQEWDGPADPEDPEAEDPEPIHVSAIRVSPEQFAAYLTEHPEINEGIELWDDEDDVRYSFDCWEADEDNSLYLDPNGTKVWLYAKSISTYKITWKLNNGEPDDVTWVEVGGKASHETPTKVNYTFKKWNNSSGGVSYGYAVQGPTTYTAQYDPIVTKHSLTLDGTIGVNFYVALPEGYTASNTAMDFSWGNKYVSTNTYSDAPYTLTNVTGTQDGSYVKYTVPVAAKELNDTITATLRSGDTVILEETYSGTDYAYALLDMTDEDLAAVLPSKTAEARELVRTMLLYCAAAQVNFAYHTDNLATYKFESMNINDALADVYIANLGMNDVYSLPYDLEYYGSSLNLGSDTALDIFFVNRTNYSFPVSASYSDGTDANASFKRSGSAVRFEVSNIPAARVLDTITMSIDGSTAYVTAQDYIYNVMTTKMNGDPLYEVCKALYNYSDSAADYFD